jgi:hypothetical protein
VDARGTVIHCAYGIVVDCQIPLPLDPVTPGRAPDLWIHRRSVDDTDVQYAPVQEVDEEEVWIEMGWDGHRTVLRFTGVIAELVDDHVLVDSVADHDVDYVGHLILDHIIPRWLALHGDLVLHAGAAVSPRGHAVALLGDPGRGKSSMTTALGQAGWGVLTDDACRLVRHGDAWQAHPSYPGTRLLSDSREVLAPLAASTPMTEGADKHRVLAGLPLAGEAARLMMVVELGEERTEPSMQRLSYSRATASLTRHSFYLAPRLADLAPRAFTLSSELAAAVPCLGLEFPRRWDVYPELIELLEQVEDSVA